MTTEDELDEVSSSRRSAVEGNGPSLEECLEEEEKKQDSSNNNVKQRQSSKNSLNDGSSQLLCNLDWHTTANMASAFSRLAAEYATMGDLSNAEALYQHAIFLSKAAMEEADTSASLSSSLFNNGNGLNSLGGFGTAIANLDQKLAATQMKVKEIHIYIYIYSPQEFHTHNSFAASPPPFMLFFGFVFKVPSLSIIEFHYTSFTH
jgi:tetratricopeptide (TPR) repeat protein